MWILIIEKISKRLSAFCQSSGLQHNFLLFTAFHCFQCPLSPPWLTSSARAIESATWRQGQQLHWLKACESTVYGIRCCRARRQGLRQDLQDSSWSLGQVAELPLGSLAWLSGARLQPATVMSKPSEPRITDNPLRPSKRVPFANEIDSRCRPRLKVTEIRCWHLMNVRDAVLSVYQKYCST